MRSAVGGTVLTRRLGLAASVVACLVLVAAAWVSWGHLSLAKNDLQVDPAAASSQPADVFTLRFRARERQPAASPGHVCVTDASHGMICAAFAAGERPADSLVNAIERRGLRAKIAR